MKTSLILGAAALLCAASAHAQIDIRVFSGGFLDEFNVAKNGMKVGIIVDTTGEGFFAGSYDAFDFSQSGQFLNTGAQQTGNWFLYSGDGYTTTTFAPMFGDSSLGSVLNIDTNGLQSGMSFALVWFANDSAALGTHYGLITHERFVIPEDLQGGQTVAPYPFNSLVPGAADYVFVPEPSTTALALIGAAGALTLYRRHRSKQA